MADIHVKPAPGRKVRRPERQGKPVPDTGAKVPDTAYYRRRLRDGDLVKTTRPKAPAAPKVKSAPEKE